MPTIPTKDAIYAAIIALLVAAFLIYSHHERVVGEDKIIAAYQRTVLVAQAKDRAIEVAASAASQKETLVYEKVVSLPPVGDLGLVCKSPRPYAVPSPATGNAGRDGGAGQLQADVFDPSRDLLTLSRSSDALARDLQAQINVMRAEMEAATKAHR